MQQQLYLMSSFRGPGVAKMVMSDVEQKLNKSPADIKVLYITTAGNLHQPTERGWINEGREIMQKHGWQVTDYDIAAHNEAEIAEAINEHAVVFVQGGNNFYLLQQMQTCNFGKIIKAALTTGKIYLGESAGAIVCADNIKAQQYMSSDALSAVPDLQDFSGLGLINFLVKPHWNRAGHKREKFAKFLFEHPNEFYSINQPIICLNDNQLIYVDGNNFQIWEGK